MTRRRMIGVAVLATTSALGALACEPADGDLLGSGGAGGSGHGGASQGGMGAGGDGGSTSSTSSTTSGSGGHTSSDLPCAPTASWEAAWTTFEDELIDAINARREAGGQCGSQTMPPTNALTLSTTLRDIARAHAEDMSVNDYIGYSSPDGEWLMQPEACGFGGPAAAQNIGNGHTSASAALDALVGYEATCLNLHVAANVVGVGYYADPNATYPSYWAVYLGNGS